MFKEQIREWSWSPANSGTVEKIQEKVRDPCRDRQQTQVGPAEHSEGLRFRSRSDEEPWDAFEQESNMI